MDDLIDMGACAGGSTASVPFSIVGFAGGHTARELGGPVQISVLATGLTAA
jgi:hypothetical protein